MELTQQHILPHVINLLLRVLVASLGALYSILNAGKGGKVLDIVKQDF